MSTFLRSSHLCGVVCAMVVLAVTVAVKAQPGGLSIKNFFAGCEERTLSDAFGLSSVHYSVDQHGLAGNPTEFVSVGRRDLLTGGYALHIVRWTTLNVPFQEALLLPVGADKMVGYSVDTMANGDVLVAGEWDDGAGQGSHVFVMRLTGDLSVLWCERLPGSFNEQPSVTARELPSGNIVIVHNEWTTGGDIGPGYGWATLLSPVGSLIWQWQFAVPNSSLGQASFYDVQQDPVASGAGPIWIAGSYRSLIDPTAMLVRLNEQFGCDQGDNTYLYPHPSQSAMQTAFTSLTFDVPPGSSTYSMVAAGTAFGGDLFAPVLPRVVNIPAGGGAATWDRLFDEPMAPAPTAISVRRALYPGGIGRIHIAGAQSQFFSLVTQAKSLELDANNAGQFVTGFTFGNGTPPFTTFNDLSPGLLKVGSRRSDANGDGNVDAADPTDMYYARQVSDCAQPYTAKDLGPGTFTFAFLQCSPGESIDPLPVIDVMGMSFDQLICRWRLPDPVINPWR